MPWRQQFSSCSDFETCILTKSAKYYVNPFQCVASGKTADSGIGSSKVPHNSAANEKGQKIDWKTIGIIAGAVLGGILVIALLAKLFGGARKEESGIKSVFGLTDPEVEAVIARQYAL